MTQTLCLNDSWTFTRDGAAPCSVVLPHSWNALDGQAGDMWKGAGTYERTLTLCADDLTRPLFLEVNGAAMTSTVTVNGTPAAHSDCPYSMYRVPLDGLVHEGENTLRITADNSPSEAVYPQMADFSFYGGVYRDVNLIAGGPVSFDLLDESRDGVRVSAQRLADGRWMLRAEGTVVNTLAPCEAAVTCQVTGRGGEEAGSARTSVFADGRAEFSVEFPVDVRHLWRGVRDPYLYTVRVCVSAHGEQDVREIPFGFRTVRFDPEHGVFLNGEHIKLRGVARHQDFGGVGPALKREHMERDLDLIAELGANAVRLSHYQHDDAFYRLCDERGLLVWAEVPFISVLSKDPAAWDNIRRQMELLVKQCANHCSICMWGVQNEITIAGETDEVYRRVSEMAQLAKRLDPTRATAQANIYSVENTSPLNRMTDAVGYNLYYGWYYGELSGLPERLDTFHADNPDVPLLVTEYGVDTNPCYHSYEPAVKDYSEDYQLVFCDNALRTFEQRDFLAGSFVWNLADFGSDIRDECGRKGQNLKGLVTIDRTLKKDAFYLYKAYWSEDPFVKLAGSRFVHRHRAENDITVLSNLPHLELYVNGEAAGVHDGVQPATVFSVCLREGKNTVLVRGRTAAGCVLEDTMELELVEAADPAYIAPKKPDSRSMAANWFAQFDFSDVTEMELDDACYSTRCTLDALMKNPSSRTVVEKYLGFLMKDPRFGRGGDITVDDLAKISVLRLPAGLVPAMNRELNVIPMRAE